MRNTRKLEGSHVDRWTSQNFDYNQSSASCVNEKKLPKKYTRGCWFAVAFGLIVWTGVLITVGILIITFAIHPATTTITQTTTLVTKTTTTSTTTTTGTNGSVLITGGYNAVVGLASTEKYIPSTGCFQTMSCMSVARYLHTADQLPSLSSFVIIAGGYNTVSGVLNTADLFDPMTGNIITIALTSLRYARRSVVFNASKLVLIGGGNGVTTIATGDVFTAGSPSLFTSANNAMPMAPFWHTATDLGNNSYLAFIAGGMDGRAIFFSAVALYQASSTAFISLVAGVNMPTTRAYHTATYLPAPYNQVLLTGGNLDSTT
ncbi:unnamed protein product [Rotaria socialis]|uniref:Uncharacterized protein n=1 Tax=Rotaria socialis TaxID=392032 RepID=A0A820QH76_9BILA|nr:unnamed protein product [Rotaria socialis]CAF4420370.1 unnamed protein product [Rotaria socialis]CAF4863471.1 unnamed protein product [Rotaria socialis]